MEYQGCIARVQCCSIVSYSHIFLTVSFVTLQRSEVDLPLQRYPAAQTTADNAPPPPFPIAVRTECIVQGTPS